MIWIFVVLLFMALLGYIVWGTNAIETTEAEYDADPEAYEARYPERRELF